MRVSMKNKEEKYRGRLKLAKNQPKAKQHTDTELFLFENYPLSLSKLSSKNNRRYCKKCIKNYVCLFKWGYVINYNENEFGNEK